MLNEQPIEIFLMIEYGTPLTDTIIIGYPSKIWMPVYINPIENSGILEILRSTVVQLGKRFDNTICSEHISGMFATFK